MTKTKKTAILIITGVLLFLLLCTFAFGVKYWSERHLFVSDVKSITAYQYENNSDYYRFEIKGTVKKWFFDTNEYNDIYLWGTEGGGEIRYFNTNAKSENISVTNKKTEFTIIFDIDKSSFNWGPDIEDYIYEERFYAAKDDNILSTDKYALFLNDFRDVEIDWKEPQTVENSPLDETE